MPNETLHLDLIEQGRFRERMDRAVRVAGRRLAKYIETFGQAAVGAKYGITFKLTFRVGDRGRVDILTHRVQHNEPGEPGEATIARAAMYGDGQYDLFVPSTGSARDPDQLKLYAEDGRSLG